MFKRDITIALEQLAADKLAMGELPMRHGAAKRRLHAPLRTERQARLETSLSRAEGVRHA